MNLALVMRSQARVRPSGFIFPAKADASEGRGASVSGMIA
jgi:hypothetical protein